MPNTTMTGNSNRATTSKMIDRRSGGNVRGPGSQTRRPGPVGDLLDRIRVGDVVDPADPDIRVSRNSRLATPVAAATSTEISPSVSQALMSTRITLTMLWPPPNSTASSG